MLRTNLLLVLSGLLVTTASAAPAKPSIAKAVRDAKFPKKVDCKAAAPARTASHNALFMNTRTNEVVSKAITWLTIEVECRRFDPVPGYPKAYWKFDGRMSYKSTGGAWIFDNWSEWGVWLEGMPPLDPAVIEAGTSDRLKVLAGSWNHLRQTTAIHSFGIRKDAKLMWTDVNATRIEMEAEVDMWDGPHLVRNRVVVPVLFNRADANSPWVAAPSIWNIVELSRRTPSEAERKSTVSVILAEERRRAAERLASLPVVEIPAFATKEDARAYVYKQLMEAPPPNLESALRRLWSGDPDEEAITSALAGQTQFQQQYCGSPAPKRDRPGFINKNDSSWTEINFVEAAGGAFKDGKQATSFKLAKLSLGVVTGDKLAALTSYSYDLCAGVLPKVDGKGQWKVGDRVEIQYIGSWEPGEIVAIVAGRLSVLDKRRNETSVMAPTKIREPQNAAPPEPAPTSAKQPGVTVKAPPSTASLPFAIGDRVQGNYAGRGKWFKGTVKDFNSARDKVFIKYDDGTSEYLKFDLVRKL